MMKHSLAPAFALWWSALFIFSVPLGNVHGKEAAGANFDNLPDISFPSTPFVVDISRAPYNARGDGVSDDTAAIERAIHDCVGEHKVIYLPAGTYLVSRTIQWTKKNSAGKDAWGHTWLQGQHAHKTILKLKDGCFQDRENPQAIMWCGGFGSADWFHNYVQDITFDVGQQNPAAIGLQFYSNNSGAVRNCRFVSSPESGDVGLDLAHRDMNGPLLIRNCEVQGYRIGIATGNAVNSQTFEHISVSGQRDLGISNTGQSLSMHDLRSDNQVTAVQSYGRLCLVHAHLLGKGKASQFPAIVNYNFGSISLRDVATEGYIRAVADMETPDSAAAFRIVGEDKNGTLGPTIREYHSHKVTSPFPVRGNVRWLVAKEPPKIPEDPIDSWACVDAFGADPTGNQDSSQAIQHAIDSGATTVFLPGFYSIRSTIVVRGKVRRILGVGAWVDYQGVAKPDFRIADGDSPFVAFEHFSHVGGGIEVDTKRTVVFRSTCDGPLRFTDRSRGMDLFIEDVCTSELKLSDKHVWARQLNIENEGTHLTNDRSELWILGYKTERGGTLLETRRGGHSQVLGGLSYTTTAGKLAPMFVTHDANVFAYFGEVCFNGDPFQTLIRETRANEMRSVERGQGNTIPYVSVHGRVPSK